MDDSIKGSSFQNLILSYYSESESESPLDLELASSSDPSAFKNTRRELRIAGCNLTTGPLYGSLPRIQDT